MDAEEIMKLFDSYWFENDLFATKQERLSSIEKPFEEEVEDTKSPSMPKLQGRSLSDRYLRYDASNLHDSSPKSVITTPKLQKIISGKEICNLSAIQSQTELFTLHSTESQSSLDSETFFSVRGDPEKAQKTKAPLKGKKSDKRRLRREGSRSLSELEFEELKGFMDLGFVFSEEDKSSSLVEVIPGLQRFGQQKNGGEEKEKKKNGEFVVSRPYLSEAWEVMEQRKANRQLNKWKFPALPNEKDMKNHLKHWAQVVASSVR